MSKRISIVFLLLMIFAILGYWFLSFPQSKIIKVGILHSLTGTMSISERAVADATLLAIKDINESGGVLGAKLQPILVDGKSDWPTFALEAERLIRDEKVSVVFGCWTSACRKTIKPIFETYDHLLFYPLQYEGVESSKNIIYTGSTPNQQIVPGVYWAFHNLGKKFFLVGSDYIFPRVAHEIIKDQLKSLGGTVVGEAYIPLGSQEVDAVIDEIKASDADVILNTINGDTNVSFFRKLRSVGITSSRIPTVSFSLAEQELKILGFENMIGDYAVWSYFQSLKSQANAEFLVSWDKFNPDIKVVSDPMESAYIGVHLWALAAQKANSVQPKDVITEIASQSFKAPQGIVYIDPDNNHTWKFARVGKIRFDGFFNIIWDSGKQIKPEPYLPFRSKEKWENLLATLYDQWDGKWSK